MTTVSVPLATEDNAPISVTSARPQGPLKANVSPEGEVQLVLPIGFKGRVPIAVVGTTQDGAPVEDTVEVEAEGPKPAVVPDVTAANKPRLRPARDGEISSVGLDGEVVLSWKPDTEAAAYDVRVNGETVCLTVYPTCSIPAPNRVTRAYEVRGINQAGETERLAAGPARAVPAGTLLTTVYFDTLDDSLTESARKKLAKLINDLLAMGLRSVSIQGHTDTRGSPADNKALSEDRAQSVERFMDRRVIDAVVDQRPLGEARPAVVERDGGGDWRNRRVEIYAR